MKRITLQEFRCFENLTVDFKPGINLLIGDNGSGKTSLLQACKYALSSFFSGFSDVNTKWLSPGSDDYFIRVANEDTVVEENPIRVTFVQDDLFEGAEGSYVIEKRSKKNSRPLLTGLQGYREAAKYLQQTYYSISESGSSFIEKPLPLFASFSTEDIHTVRKISENQFLKFQNKPSFGYFECLDCNGLLKYWRKRLLVLAEAGKSPIEIEVVRNAVVDALGTEGCGIINEMSVRPIHRQIVYHYVDGREVELDYLSDGYKRLVNIVTDLAFRCVILNKGIYGEQCIKETRGTVLIDEIDMHLHPRLQACVMKGLRHAFPKLQFIVATHAPMVMTGVMNDAENSVIRLVYSDGSYRSAEVDTYGLSASEILQLVLSVNPRDSEVDERIKSLYDDLDHDRYDHAKKKLAELVDEFGESIPDLIQAQTILDLNS